MKRLVLLVATIIFCLSVARSVEAQSELPPECYTDGYVDLHTCLPDRFWDIPLSELSRGYYGVFGRFIPRLADDRMNYYAPGFHLSGNASRYSASHMEIAFHEKIERWNLAARGLSADDYVNGIALESCGYMEFSAWVQVPGQELIGPFLVVDCRALVHKFELACLYGAVVEVVYEDIGHEAETGLIEGVEVYIQPPWNLDPPHVSSSPPTPYTESWLREAEMTC